MAHLAARADEVFREGDGRAQRAARSFSKCSPASTPATVTVTRIDRLALDLRPLRDR
jgi:hypothetical protein